MPLYEEELIPTYKYLKFNIHIKNNIFKMLDIAMGEPYRYNHFVPKFIVNEFSNNSKISIYDYRRRKTYITNTEKAFGQNRLYHDYNNKDKTAIEKDLNTKIEHKFAPIAKKIIDCKTDSVSLSVEEIDEIRRFFLSEFIRVPSKEVEEKGWERHLEPKLNNMDPSELEKTREKKLKIIYPDKSFKNNSLLSEKEQLLEDLKIIIKNSYREIINDNNCSLSLANLYRSTEIADIGIWRCYRKDEFVLTDSYLINECDQSLIYGPMTSTHAFLIKLSIANEDNPEALDQIHRMILDIKSFHEIVWFTPISSDLMIVLVSPVYKWIFEGSLMAYWKYIPKSKIPDLYFYPISTRNVNSDQIMIQQLDWYVTRYVNALMLDRIQDFLGFKTGSKIIKSLEFYRDGAQHIEFHYESLIKELKESSLKTN